MSNKVFQILIFAVVLTNGLTTAQAQRKAQANLIEVKIYLAKEAEDYDAQYDAKNPHGLVAVRRKVGAKSPLSSTLKALTEGATRAEVKQKLFSVTYGIKFVSARLEKGTAYTYFTMPEGATFSGDLSPLIFRDAVEKTALQFASVRKVEVCLDGILDFWSEAEDGGRKCHE
jgi:hypothetical protein